MLTTMSVLFGSNDGSKRQQQLAEEQVDRKDYSKVNIVCFG